jgi:flagellar hook-associated protein 3 FlgL
MNAMNFGDLSQYMQLRRDTVRARQDLAQASQELATGKTTDVGRKVAGDFGPLVAIDRQMSALEGYRTNAKEAALMADGAQAALGLMQDVVGDMGIRLVGLETGDLVAAGEVFANDARVAFEASVSALNGTVSGRSLFAGAATDRAALAPADDMLGDLRTLVAAETTAAGVAAAVEAWFAPGGGFDTAGYIGSAEDQTGAQVAEGRTVTMGLRADDPAVRDHLKGLAMAALLNESGIDDVGQQEQLARYAGEAIIDNQSNVVAQRAEMGSIQAIVEDATAQNAAAISALELARSDVVSVDPYKAATELQNLEAQLQTIYTITARLSGLSLTNFLR